MAGEGRGDEKTSLQLEMDFMMRRKMRRDEEGRRGRKEENERITNAAIGVRRGWEGLFPGGEDAQCRRRQTTPNEANAIPNINADEGQGLWKWRWRWSVFLKVEESEVRLRRGVSSGSRRMR